MKIGNKYEYYESYIKPNIKDYKEEEDDYHIANTCYRFQEEIKYFSAEPVDSSIALKIKKTRIEKRNIKIGNFVYVVRWDNNGNPDKLEITKIKIKRKGIKVYCNEGWFKFTKKNFKKDNIDFNWTCKGKEWQKINRKWINGSEYYYKS